MKKVFVWLLIYIVIGILGWLYAKLTGGIGGDLTFGESITTFLGFVLLWPLLLANGIAKSLI